MVKVSCLCPTYNRLELLPEAIESFVRQSFPLAERELVILNDCWDQRLECETPGVRVVNLRTRLESLGEKFNLLVELTRGDILLPWEDDDISLPGRIQQAVDLLPAGHKWTSQHSCENCGIGLAYQRYLGEPCPKQLGYWKPPQVWFMEGQHLHWKHNVGVRHHASAFTREAWRRVGGYPPISGAQDAGMDQRLGGYLLPAFPDGIPPQAWQYIYRWGVTDHLSGHADLASAWQAEADKWKKNGTFLIQPAWRQDYQALTQSVLKI